MLWFAFVLAMLGAGYSVSSRIWAWGGDAREPLGPFERASSCGLVALALAVATDWGLALIHRFDRTALAVAALALFGLSWRDLGALVSRLRARPRVSAAGEGPRPAVPGRPRDERLAVSFAVAPLLLWIAYVLVRGTIVFPFAPDALAYHLPKALYIARTHAYGFFDGPDMRLPTFPADYEMLLADVLSLTGSDTLVGTVGVFVFVLFAAVVAGMAERWWGRGALHVVTTTTLTVAMPTVVLGCGVHKNDVMLATCVLAAVHWTARWAMRGERAALLLAMAAASLAVGTKLNGGVLVGALLPGVLWRMHASRRSGGRASGREISAWVGSGAVLLLLLGGAAYVVNVIHMGRPLVTSKVWGYGDWKNLWTFPYLVFARPLSPVDASWVPWRHEYWFWPTWDFHFSTYGLQSTIALLAMPFAIARYRSDGRRTERLLASSAALLAWLAILPMRLEQPPVGFFEGFVRYTFFFPPVLLLWTVAPAVRELSRRAGARAFALASVMGSGVCFGVVALRAADDDYYVPGRFVAAALADPELARVIRAWPSRAGSWVDANAADHDTVAFDGAFDAWIYPVFGRGLTRRLVFLHSDGRQPVAIADDVQWVAIDRSWHCVFGHPDFTDFGVWDRYIFRGQPLPEELAVYRQLLADPRFTLVYRDERANQAVFRRVKGSIANAERGASAEPARPQARAW